MSMHDDLWWEIIKSLVKVKLQAFINNCAKQTMVVSTRRQRIGVFWFWEKDRKNHIRVQQWLYSIKCCTNNYIWPTNLTTEISNTPMVFSLTNVYLAYTCNGHGVMCIFQCRWKVKIDQKYQGFGHERNCYSREIKPQKVVGP